MRGVDIPLQYMTNVVSTCIALHNMCTIENDKSDMEWIEEGKREFDRRIDNILFRYK